MPWRVWVPVALLLASAVLMVAPPPPLRQRQRRPPPLSSFATDASSEEELLQWNATTTNVNGSALTGSDGVWTRIGLCAVSHRHAKRLSGCGAAVRGDRKYRLSPNERNACGMAAPRRLASFADDDFSADDDDFSADDDRNFFLEQNDDDFVSEEKLLLIEAQKLPDTKKAARVRARRTSRQRRRRKKTRALASSSSSSSRRRKLVTIAYLYYRDAKIFAETHVPDWERWPAELLEQIFFLIVDDGSPPGERAVDVLRGRSQLDLLFATIACDVGWNIHGARNLLFHVAPTEFVLMLDADTGVPWTFANALFAMVRHSQEYRGDRLIFRRFRRVQRTCNLVNSPELLASDEKMTVEHPAAMLLARTTYWHVGGCDEDFVGAYGSTHFRYRADLAPGVRSVFPGDNVPRLIAHTCAGVRRPPASRAGRHKKRSSHVSNADAANADLFKQKKHHKLPWASDYLRFDFVLHTNDVAGGTSPTNRTAAVYSASSASSASSSRRRKRRHLRRQ